MKFLEVDFKRALDGGCTKEGLIAELEEAKKHLKWYVCDALKRGRLIAEVSSETAAVRNAIALAMTEENIGMFGLMRWASENNPSEGLECDYQAEVMCPPSALAYRKAWIDHMIEELKK